MMEYIKEISDYGEELGKKFMQPIFHIGYPMKKMTLYDVDGLKCMVTQVEEKINEDGQDSYLVSYEEDGQVKVASTCYKKDFFQVETEERSYIMQPNCATYYDKINDLGGQLIYVNDVEEAGKVLACQQWNPLKLKKSFVEYIVDEYNDPTLVLDYLNNRRANYYEFTVGGRVINATKGYVLCDDNNYYQCSRKEHDIKRVIKRRPYSEDFMRTVMAKNGFNENVPEELISLFKGKINQFSDLQNITDEYIKSMK